MSWTTKLADAIDAGLASGEPTTIKVKSCEEAELGRSAAERMAARDGGDPGLLTFEVESEVPL